MVRQDREESIRYIEIMDRMELFILSVVVGETLGCGFQLQENTRHTCLQERTDWREQL